MKSPTLRSAASLALLLAVPGLLAAQTTGGIRGRTLEGGLVPLGGVEVLVDRVPRSVLSGPGGAFLLDGLPPGEYQVTARIPGFAPVRIVVGIRAGVVLDIELHLERLPQELDTIRVVAPIGPPFLLGSVHDTHGRPLENVEVLLEGFPQRAVTGPTGRFRFDSLPAGSYNLTARYPGFIAARSRILVQPGGTEVALRMREFTQVLETIEVVADRRGLYGVVATGQLQPIPGARVRVHGGGTGQVTDSAGRFAFPGLKPGEYLLSAERAGMEGRRLFLEIPRNGRLEVSLTLSPENPSRRPPPTARWIDHDLGLMLSFSPSWKRVSRQDLARMAGRQLCDVGRIRREARGTEAAIIVDGMRALMPWSLCAFSTDEVALVTFGGCRVNGMPITPPAGLRCIGVWMR